MRRYLGGGMSMTVHEFNQLWRAWEGWRSTGQDWPLTKGHGVCVRAEMQVTGCTTPEYSADGRRWGGMALGLSGEALNTSIRTSTDRKVGYPVQVQVPILSTEILAYPLPKYTHDSRIKTATTMVGTCEGVMRRRRKCESDTGRLRLKDSERGQTGAVENVLALDGRSLEGDCLVPLTTQDWQLRLPLGSDPEY
ncbi:hypothetical protein JB92DRAFT_3098666 [Gautieria morchelliformis]|nr:hypothetical protein JB92DRAFT_3098666 [Gautieria morchelliformis]